jgi:glycosyltransferase involved in cell wall biosynthesis
MSLVHHQRLAGPAHVSIERLFDEVRRHLPEHWHARMAVCPHLSQGILPRIGNMRAARRNRGEVNHIVGDVHYLAMALPCEGLVLTVHDCATLQRLKGVTREVFRQLWFVQPMKRARVVTTISHAMRKELHDWMGHLANDVRVVPNCVRTEFVRVEKSFNPEAPVVLQVGTGWNKNVERVAESLRGTSCRLDIIGALSDIQRRSIELTGTVFRELGRLTDEQVMEAYQQCDILVFASIYEGFGLPILEAQATGRPVVTSNYGAMAEAAGMGAILVDPRDAKAIRQAVIGLCENDHLRKDVVLAGFENLKKYQAEAVAAAYAAIYEECSR